MRPSELYRETATRIMELVDDAPPAVPVAACSEWTVRELTAHLVGLAADVVVGNVDGYATAPWTAAQVASRADASIADLTSEWQTVMSDFLAVVDDLGGSSLPAMVQTALGPMPKEAFEVAFTVDALQHELDLRVSLAEPRDPIIEQDGAVMRAMVSTVRGIFAFAELPTVVLRAADADLEWRIGRDEPLAVCEAPLLDLVRSLGGRRSLDQLRSLPWQGEPNDDVVAALVVPFFAAPQNSVESAFG